VIHFLIIIFNIEYIKVLNQNSKQNMALYFLGYELEVLEERLRLIERRMERRMLRDTQNPYELPRREFMNLFRLSPELSMDFTNTLRPILQRERNSGIPVEIQVTFFIKII